MINTFLLLLLAKSHFRGLLLTNHAILIPSLQLHLVVSLFLLILRHALEMNFVQEIWLLKNWTISKRRSRRIWSAGPQSIANQVLRRVAFGAEQCLVGASGLVIQLHRGFKVHALRLNSREIIKVFNGQIIVYFILACLLLMGNNLEVKRSRLLSLHLWQLHFQIFAPVHYLLYFLWRHHYLVWVWILTPSFGEILVPLVHHLDESQLD